MADFTISDVLAWARTKPADERYSFLAAEYCAVAQFGRETGREYLVGILSDEIEANCAGLRRAACSLNDGGWTFGGLVARLEAICPDTPATPSEWTKADAYMTEQVSA
jgi:hypothetical protein